MSGWSSDLLSQHLERELGAIPQRASVTFLGAEPIDVLRFADEAAAARNQQEPTQWSMFRIDRDRDGRIDD